MFPTITPLIKKKNIEDLFFLSLLYQKFNSKCISGGHNSTEKILLQTIFVTSATKIFKKPFFFVFFHMLEKLSVSFTLLSKRKGRRLYSIPAPIHFHKRYKKAFQLYKEFFSRRPRAIANLFSKEKPAAKAFFFLLSYLFKLRNPVTAGVYEFKKKVKNNRIFAHWRWR